jgi:glycerophosphoryl diester phosphodiesterase
MARSQIAAHRGGAILWPENSLSAVRQAARTGVEQVEIDVHLTADGEVVVLHDATLDRTTDATGPVRARTAASLRDVRLRGGGGETVPMLADAARLTRDAGRILRLEVKADPDGRPYPGLVAHCAAVLDDLKIRNHTVLMSFQPLSVAEAATLGGFLGLTLLLYGRLWRGTGAPAAAALCHAVGATELGLPIAEWDAASITAVRLQGLGVSAWGADTRPALERALGLDLDVVTTDDPPLALRLRG